MFFTYPYKIFYLSTKCEAFVANEFRSLVGLDTKERTTKDSVLIETKQKNSEIMCIV